ncbi:MAG: nucleotide exchange factor GrpE [Nanoarchaeota archaeon]|nr:nucleotide exchange factor GrpE [Nanoarchaeota archaeon]
MENKNKDFKSVENENVEDLSSSSQYKELSEENFHEKNKKNYEQELDEIGEEEMKKNDTYVEVDEDTPTIPDDMLQEELEKEQKLQLQYDELKDDYLRLKADFENYRKRMQEENLKSKERAVSSFVSDLLPSIDNFEMSLKMTQDTTMFIKGVEMIHQNLLNVLQNHSISIYEPQIGQEFNVKEHEPILIEHHEYPVGTIVGVLQKGYKLKDSILRPARVQVVKEKEEK